MKQVFSRSLLAGAMFGSLLTIAACQPADRGPSPGMGDPVPPPLNDPQITVLAPDLREWLAFDTAIITRMESQPMAVEVPVRNMSDRLYLIDYRFTFYDEHDRQLDSADGWQPAALEAKQRVRLKANALSAHAANYRLEVKWQR